MSGKLSPLGRIKLAPRLVPDVSLIWKKGIRSLRGKFRKAVIKK